MSIQTNKHEKWGDQQKLVRMYNIKSNIEHAQTIVDMMTY